MTPTRGRSGPARPARSAPPSPEQVTAAREAALRLLSVRERSARELALRLGQKGFSPEAIAEALERLKAIDLQSDTRFADRWTAAAAGRGMAARRIQGELRARGVDPEVAAQAAAADPEAERDRALAFARDRAARMPGADPQVVARRIAGLLARRGYDAETCRAVSAAVAGDDVLDPDSS